MNFYVIEIQTNSDGTSGNIITGYDDKLVAEDAFCQGDRVQMIVR